MVPKILIHESSEIPSHYGSIDSGVDESGFQQIELNPCGVISEEVDEEEPSTSKIKVRNKYEICYRRFYIAARQTTDLVQIREIVEIRVRLRKDLCL